ncbi:MAG: hypothetical protein A4S09_13245 [Proteobacteria bacterium SG_bin7]|nr:MAG: hypothetical protein A4S09_13245 [Proteobacteria bacterium SG_bin7]
MKYILLIFLLGLTGCSLFSLKKPEVKMESLTVKKFTEREIDLNVTLEVKNPNSRDLEIDDLRYTFQLNDSAPFKQELGTDINVDANSTKKIELPMVVPTSSLVGAVFDMLVDKPLTYNFAGSLKVNGMHMTFNKSGNMPKRQSRK